MIRPGLSIACGILQLLPVLCLAEPHEEVQAALDWELPPTECKKPRLIGAEPDIFDNIRETSIRFDVDHYQLDAYKRAEKRWVKCVLKYRQRLMADFEELKNSAQYGLTKGQAELILGKMALIQSVLISPDTQQPVPAP